MTDYLRIASSLAVELWTAPEVDGTTLTPTDCFHADVAASFVPANGGKVGMVTTDGGKTWSDPPKPPASVRSVRGVILVKALDKSTKVCPRDLAYVSALDAAREDMPSVIRIAGVDGRQVSDWFDTALGVTS